jgi:hypothetical protein
LGRRIFENDPPAVHCLEGYSKIEDLADCKKAAGDGDLFSPDSDSDPGSRNTGSIDGCILVKSFDKIVDGESMPSEFKTPTLFFNKNVHIAENICVWPICKRV